jgi:predicted RecB family nuclease
MTAKITKDVVESYLHCKYKGHLKLTGQQGTKCDYETLLTEMRAEVRLATLDKILARHPGEGILRNVPLTTPVLRQGVSFILDTILEDDVVSLHFDGLKKVDGPSKLGAFHYVPVLFHEGSRVGKDQQLLLGLYGLLLSRLQGHMPVYGLVWHGRECKSTRVRLNADLRRTERLLRDLKEICGAKSAPQLTLNDHCQVCEFRQRCHARAVEEDNLSLLRGMGEKDVVKLNKKGIFTITQYSYTFRPRRKNKKAAPPPCKHLHSLQALAIRENAVLVVAKQDVPLATTLVYLDVEGTPDRDSYYLIGLRIVTGTSAWQHSYWADSDGDEGTIWRSFLGAMAGLEQFVVFHYGGYESRFLKVMRERYGGDAALLDRIDSATVNVLSLIYARIYYPVNPNDLKSIASCLGFHWSSAGASGIQAIVWRAEWEAGNSQPAKTRLVAYNQEDCVALQHVVGSLYSIMDGVSQVGGDSQKAVTSVDNIPEQSHRKLGSAQFALPELARITKCAYFNYQRDKILFRTSPVLKKLRRQQESKKRKKHRVNAQVVYRAPRKCPKCEGSSLTAFGTHRKLVLDLKVTGSGIKRWVTRHVSRRYRCCDCYYCFLPGPYLAISSRYGEVLRKWVTYTTIALRQTNENVVDSLGDLFGIRISPGRVTEFRQGIARHYKRTYEALLRSLVRGQLIHADETRVCIKGRSTDGYVWAFATITGVVYVYSPTREGDVVRDTLEGFKGVLISDFYSAYDALECPQQKCLIHLARDFNDDLLKNPFDEELRTVASRFTALLQQIVETIDRFGLKKIHLNKHKRDVQRFYDELFGGAYKSETAQYYQKRIEKYKDKLFLFLDYDGVPWNNNTAENAVKLIASRRKVIGTAFTEDGIKDYLVLLSIYQTLRYRQASFLTFLLSGKAIRGHRSFWREPTA